MCVYTRKLIKYNAYYTNKKYQHIAIHYYIITVILHYFINISITTAKTIITVKYIITLIKTCLLHVQLNHLL
jgi:hypothetical protein